MIFQTFTHMYTYVQTHSHAFKYLFAALAFAFLTFASSASSRQLSVEFKSAMTCPVHHKRNTDQHGENLLGIHRHLFFFWHVESSHAKELVSLHFISRESLLQAADDIKCTKILHLLGPPGFFSQPLGPSHRNNCAFV